MQSDEPSTSSASSSRRRIAFGRPPVLRERPLQSPAPITSTSLTSGLDKEPQTSTDNTTTNGEILNPSSSEPTCTSVLSDQKSLDLPKRRAWSFDEVCAFHDGIKLHGKDFDSVVKFMAKRKMEKTKDHVKTFFFNSAKAYKSLLAMTDDDFANIPRDARELFLLINACEYKRKTVNMKVIVEKLKELVFEGTVVVRAGRKLVTIKTPPCPALCRYFSVKKGDKVPNDLYIHLEPTSNGDHVFMRQRNQNPFLRVKLNANDRITKLLEFLHKKWSLAGDSTPISVTLWPDSSCEIASLCVQSAENSPFISLSMNKLIKNVEESKEKLEAKKIEVTGIKVATDVNIKTKPSHTVTYPRPFTLTDEIIAEGINSKNVRNAIVAELFCVCGRKNPIQLRYQVHNENQPIQASEPWKVMINLLNRGYGDCLAPSKTRKRDKPTADSEPSSSASKKKKCDDTTSDVPGNPVSDIVRQETEDFACQLAFLKKTTRKKTAPAKRKPTNPVLATVTPQLLIRPPPGESSSAPAIQDLMVKQVFAAPKTTIIPRRTSTYSEKKSLLLSNAHKISELTATSDSPSTSTQGPTDFSSVVFSPTKRSADPELQRKRNDAFLSSLRTPDPTPKKDSIMQQYFGGDLSMSPGSTRHASHLETPGGNNTTIDFTDMMYQNITNHGDLTTISNPALHFSVNEVHEKYHDMISSSQDSQDYILSHFQKKKTTPKKKK
ncbi:Myb-like domain-containing protein [Caenorhabditis elegans]|uniref:Myb-like domain-containing protein n=3 Tax=Caenorhabditis elegans TaxID=6239 RepID=Q21999_CAEEL|nr:Myb-like domain-containing protein [Caenorhabditis elegans]CCD70763.2 Myb-like domain-containing protein [Caenorhabditis elegans]